MKDPSSHPAVTNYLEFSPLYIVISISREILFIFLCECNDSHSLIFELVGNHSYHELVLISKSFCNKNLTTSTEYLQLMIAFYYFNDHFIVLPALHGCSSGFNNNIKIDYSGLYGHNKICSKSQLSNLVVCCLRTKDLNVHSTRTKQHLIFKMPIGLLLLTY